jgi:hypothetical protein
LGAEVGGGDDDGDDDASGAFATPLFERPQDTTKISARKQAASNVIGERCIRARTRRPVPTNSKTKVSVEKCPIIARLLCKRVNDQPSVQAWSWKPRFGPIRHVYF